MDIPLALQHMRPGEEWTLNGDTYDGLTWLSKTKPPTEAEIQVISCGDLAFVALPGEPLIEISFAIQKASPFPHTLVLGYSNGDGVEYVGPPGEKIKGGYEMGPDGRGTDECGGMMVATALRLLREHRGPLANR